MIGDFNEILHSDEYWGSGSRPFNQIAEFIRVANDCSLINLGYRGPKFTWCNRRFEENLVYARLDRGLHNLEWVQLFPPSKLSHVPFGFSYHMALQMNSKQKLLVHPSENTKCLRFEVFWMHDPNCEDINRSSWNSLQWGTPMFRVTQKIKAVRVALL